MLYSPRALTSEQTPPPAAPQPVVMPYTPPAEAGAAPMNAQPPGSAAAYTVAAPAPPPPPAAPAWMPTHVVPAAGMAAWAAPDPSQPAAAQLAPGVQLRLVEQQGDWARVTGSNGWVGWVDARLLTPTG